MQLRASLSDRKSEPRARHIADIAAAMKWLEHAWHIISRNAYALITHAKDDVIILDGHIKPYRLAWRRVFHGIGKQVAKNGAEQRRIQQRLVIRRIRGDLAVGWCGG